jgi:hypothetical protein
MPIHPKNDDSIENQINKLNKKYRGLDWSKSAHTRLAVSQLSNIGPGYYESCQTAFIRKKMRKRKGINYIMLNSAKEKQENFKASINESPTDQTEIEYLPPPKKPFNFGSLSERFKNSKCSHLGPGIYHPHEIQIQRRRCITLKVKNRFAKREESPGPGMYNNVEVKDIYKKSSPTVKGAFGSSEKRFIPKVKKLHPLILSDMHKSTSLENRGKKIKGSPNNNSSNQKYISSILNKFKVLKVYSKEKETANAVSLPKLQNNHSTENTTKHRKRDLVHYIEHLIRRK